MLEDLYELASMLELCFGDVEDDTDGFRDLCIQVAAYPERAAVVLSQLDVLLSGGDGACAARLLREATHRTLDGVAALAWLSQVRALFQEQVSAMDYVASEDQPGRQGEEYTYDK